MRGRFGYVVVMAALALACREGQEIRAASAVLSAEPREVSFGPTALGESKPREVTLVNRGTAPLRVTAVTSSTPRVTVERQPPFELAGGASIGLSLHFAPSDEGEVIGQVVVVTDESGETRETALQVEGRGVRALADLETDALDFGRVELGTAEVRELRLVNPREVPVEVALALGGPDADAYTLPLRSLTLQPSEERALSIGFKPSRLGLSEATALVELCGGCEPAPVALNGSGIAAALDISPAWLDFGKVPVGSTLQEPVVIRNLGTVDVWFEGALVTSDGGGVYQLLGSSAADGTRVPPGGRVEVTVAFSPAQTGAAPEGVLELRVWPEGSTSPAPRLALSGEGGSRCVAVYPSSLEFGVVPEGSEAVGSVEVYNRCGEPVEVADLQVAATEGGYFSLALALSRFTIASGESAPVEVAFTPRAGSTASTGALTFQVLASGTSSSERVGLQGSTAVFEPCSFAFEPAAVDFQQVSVGTRVITGVALRNLGTDRCFISRMGLVSGSDPEFAAPALRSLIVEAGEKAVLPISFQPGSAGLYGAMVEALVNHPTDPRGTTLVAGEGVHSCFTLEPASVSFGRILLGCPVASRDVVGRNRCPEAVEVTAATLGGGPELSLYGPAAPVWVAAGAEARFRIDYLPVDGDVDSAQLTVETRELGTFAAGVMGEGDPDGRRTDRFVQEGQSKVDVLFVVDNSGSMTEEQDGLAANFAAFMSAAQRHGVDYHLAVTTTGIQSSPNGWTPCPGGANGGEGGRFFPVDNSRPRIITPETAGAEAVFSANVQVGICHWDEQGIEAAYRALSGPLVNSPDDSRTTEPADGNGGFLREDARLAIVFVSDEEDFSPQPVSFYEAFFRTLKSDPSLLSISAIVTPADLPSCPTGSSVGSRYLALARANSGVEDSICTQDWAKSLSRISENAFGLRRSFPLSEEPRDPAAIEVRIDGQLQTSGWRYVPEGNAVAFTAEEAPAGGAVIEISYEIGC